MSTTRFLGNRNKTEVHDLLKKKNSCHIDKIKPEHKVYFATLEAAHRAGYDNCAHCLGRSKR